MRVNTTGGGQGGRWLLGLAWVLLAVSSLSGCAAGPDAEVAATDIVTESDEPAYRKRARIRLELAVGYFEQGQTTVALDELKQSLAADPNFVEAHNLRGLIYMRLNDLSQAEEGFRRALALNPGNANVLHNYGWLLCQQGRYGESNQMFAQAIANPTYGARAKTWLTQGLCQMRAQQPAEAEYSLGKAYELDPANPVTGYNLAALLHQRGEQLRAQFYIRRINNSELANAETLWLGIKIEHRLGRQEAVEQLAGQLRKRYPQSRELGSYERGAFHE